LISYERAGIPDGEIVWYCQDGQCAVDASPSEILSRAKERLAQIIEERREAFKKEHGVECVFDVITDETTLVTSKKGK
jgi:hypothetical protein